MSYKEAFAYINSFTNYEKVPGLDRDLSADGLERFRLLTRLLGRPQSSFKSIVVAGTKGKGSVAAMLDAVLRQAGHRTGLYTSPHLHTFRERMRVNGEMISPAGMARIVDDLKPVVERIKGLGDPTLMPTTYELATAIAFKHFQEQSIEYGILEVGLGGRLDAVNITEPLVSVITSISMDHMEVLGDTLGKIAREKAGIIKPRGQVVSAPQDEEALKVIQEVAETQHANLTVVGDQVYVGTGHLPEVVSDEEGIPVFQAFTIGFEGSAAGPAAKLRVKLPLLGSHQQVNAAVVLAALRKLQDAGVEVSRQAILGGLSSVNWPGRLEIVHRKPVVIVDGAHNNESVARLGQAVNDLFHGREVVVVAGISRDKNVEGILKELRAWEDGLSGPRVERVIVTRSSHPRAADPRTIAQQAVAMGLTVEFREDVRGALSRAESMAVSPARGGGSQPVVLVTGSLFLVAEARRHYGLAPDLREEES